MEWKKLISELMNKGLTQAQIASKTGVPQPTISALLNEKQKELSYLNGNSLVRFHKKAMARREVA